MEFTFDDITRSSLFETTTKKFLETSNLEVIPRPACFIIRPKSEDAHFVKRLIVFPPNGFTADEKSMLNPHPEARKARVKILGEINPFKKGFRPLVRKIEFTFSIKRDIPTENGSAYARFSKEFCGSLLKSWKNWFYVTKENGWGFFHNLVNLSIGWVLAVLEKHLVDQKEINIRHYLDQLSKPQQNILLGCLREIQEHGDGIFENKNVVSEVLKFPSSILVPILVQMLSMRENGKHEPCTIFALLLKIAKSNRNVVLKEVDRAKAYNLAPSYYLDEMAVKLRRNHPPSDEGTIHGYET